MLGQVRYCIGRNILQRYYTLLCLITKYCRPYSTQNSDTNVLRVSKVRYPNTACFIPEYCEHKSTQYLGTNVVMAIMFGTRILRALKHAIFGYQCCDGSLCLVPEYCEHKSTQYSGTNIHRVSKVWYPNTASIIARNIRVPKLFFLKM